MPSFRDEPGTVVLVASPRRIGGMHAVVRGHARMEPRAAAFGLLALALSAFSFVRFGLAAEAFVAALVACVLVAVSAVDIAERRIPNRIVLPATAAVLTARTALEPDRVFEWVLAAAAAAVFLFLPSLLHAGAVGFGDVKLALFLGAALGASVAPALALAFLAAGAGALVLLAVRGAAARNATIPFAPFLAFGALAVLLGQPV